MNNKKSIAKDVARELAQVGGESVKEVGKQASEAVGDAVSELTGSSQSDNANISQSKQKSSKGKVDFQWENQKQEEIDQIKQAIKTASSGSKQRASQPKRGSLDQGGRPGAQDMERQVEEVRKGKERKETKKKEDEKILKQLREQREQEEQEAQADAQEILPSSNRPQQGSALQKRSKKGGTSELSKLKN